MNTWTHVKRLSALGEPLLELRSVGEDRIEVGIGGDVANGLICLSRLLAGHSTQLSLVTALGNSSYAGWLRERLHSERLVLSEFETPPGTEPGIYGVPLQAPARGTFSYWREQSAARVFLARASFEDFERLLGTPDLLLVTGITLALCSEGSFEALCAWAQRHRHECAIVFDTNYRRALWPSALAAHRRISRFETFASLIATGMEDEAALRQSHSVAEIIDAHQGLAAELLIRLGPEGCVVKSPGVAPAHVPAEAVTVTDATGAGDAHLAGYLAARVLGTDPLPAAAFANQVAAVIVTQPGSAARPQAPFPPVPIRRPT